MGQLGKSCEVLPICLDNLGCLEIFGPRTLVVKPGRTSRDVPSCPRTSWDFGPGTLVVMSGRTSRDIPSPSIHNLAPVCWIIIYLFACLFVYYIIVFAYMVTQEHK